MNNYINVTTQAIKQFYTAFGYKDIKQVESELESLFRTSIKIGETTDGHILCSTYRPELKMVVQEHNKIVAIFADQDKPVDKSEEFANTVADIESEIEVLSRQLYELGQQRAKISMKKTVIHNKLQSLRAIRERM